MRTTARVELPPKLIDVFKHPRGALRYRGAFGGRGSAKSFSFAKMAAIWGAIEPLRILCVREYQNSIKESFYAELKNAIESEPWLNACYSIGVDFIKSRSGSEFLFKGLRHNVSSVKSTANIDLCIVEEAEAVSETSWQVLLPTIRAPKSEVWVIWNPEKEGSATDKRFRQTTPERSAIVEMNYRDNPWFPDVLEELRKADLKNLNHATYMHVWEGYYHKQSDAQIFAGKYIISDFEPAHGWDGPYQGLDFGFANDPLAAVRCWIHDDRLYIGYDASKVGVELDHITAFVDGRIPEFKRYITRADSARPDSISYLKRHGYPRVRACEKGKGSIMDGVEFIKSFNQVVIHPRCKATQDEFLNYSYKVDRLSGDILPDIVDAYNHCIDGIRYALEPIMKRKKIDYKAFKKVR